MKERKRPKSDPTRPLECGVGPGEVLFVPHGWWHSVFNYEQDEQEKEMNGDDIDKGLTIALTQNFVSTSNLSDVLRFLDKRESQISGVRDIIEEGAINPEELLSTFKSKLRASGIPNVNEILDKAEERANRGWDADAWNGGILKLKKKVSRRKLRA